MKLIDKGLQTPTGFKRPSKLNVLIADASGSMYWAMSNLAADTKERVTNLPAGDAVLIGIFSGEGWFRWILQTELNTDADYALARQVIDREFHVRGTTCFSEILADFPRAVAPMLQKYPVATMTFMSDGQPVVRDTRMEIANALQAAGVIGQYIVAGSVIGYGDYANRDLLGKLAQAAGAELITAKTIQEVGEAFSRNSGSPASKKRKVKIPQDALLVFSMDQQLVAPLSQKQNEVQIAEEADVYAVQTADDLRAMPQTEDPERVMYAVALGFLAQGNADNALQALSTLGDVHMVRVLGNALTNAELAEAEGLLRTALVDPNARFKGGRTVGCLPDPNAPDLLQVLDTLMADEHALFYPTHEDFKYKRSGRKSRNKDGYPKFIPQDGVGVPISKLVGNSKELNLSVLARIPGTIPLPEEAGDVKRVDTGYDANYQTFVWRNYSLIVNGLPQVEILPCSTGEATFLKLRDLGVIDPQALWEDGEVYNIMLSYVPVCNRARGENATDWTALARMEIESLKLGAQIKVLKAKKKELDPEGEAAKPLDLTDAQVKFLDAVGIRLSDMSYSPPTVQEDATDVQTVRQFEIKVAKTSSITMQVFNEAVEKGKALNQIGQWMKVGYDLIVAQMPKTKGAALEWLDQQITGLLTAQRNLDQKINNQRFAVAVGGHWARHFKEDEHAMVVDGLEVKLVFRQVEKDI